MDGGNAGVVRDYRLPENAETSDEPQERDRRRRPGNGTSGPWIVALLGGCYLENRGNFGAEVMGHSGSGYDGPAGDDPVFSPDSLIQAARLGGTGALLLVDLSDRRIVACNESMARLSGYSVPELTRHTTEVLHLDHERFERFARELKEAFASGRKTYRCHYYLRRRNGEHFPAEMTVSGIFPNPDSRIPPYVVGLIRDLSEFSDSVRRMPDSVTVDALAENLPGGIFQRVLMPDGESYYTYLRGRLLKTLGLDPVAAQRNPELLMDRLYPDDRRELADCIERSARDLSPIEIDLRFRDSRDHTIWVRSVSQPRRLDDGSTVWDGIVFDITPQRSAEQTIERLAYRDDVTGLPNQSLFREYLAREIETAQRNGRKLAVAAVNVVRFHVVNETLGFQKANQLLADIGQRLSKEMPANGFVARFHGDEFLLLLPDVTDEDALVRVFRQLLEAFRQPFQGAAGEETRLDIRAGVARFPEDGNGVEELLLSVDTALAQARKYEDRPFAFYSPEMTHTLVDKLGIEKDLRSAIENEDIEPYFQPQFNLETGELAGFETLARWSRDGDWISPGRFVPIAEETGLIGPLGELIAGKTMRQIAEWRSEGLTVPQVTINYSVYQLRQSGFEQEILAQLLEYGLPVDQVAVEITESAFLFDFRIIRNIMDNLSRHGLTFSIDDFGTGYSSFSYLSQLPFSVLKIDRSFLVDLTKNHRNQRLVQALIQIGEGLHMTQVIAEGVETGEQLEMLRRFGCGFAQGFLLGRPMPAHEARKLLQSPPETT